MIVFALIVASATLAVGAGAVAALRLLPTARLQLMGLALLAVVLPLLSVLLSGFVMFHMGADVKLLAVATASASAAVCAALLLSNSISGGFRRVVAVATQISEGNLSARVEVRGPRELAELARAINLMAASVEEVSDTRRQLVAGASHDLRAPISAIRAMLEAVEDGLVEAQTYLPALQEQAATLARLVDDLFELARVDSGVLNLELRDAPVGDLVASCLRGIDAEARTRRIRLESRIDDRLPEARCAPEQVERVLLNLLTNALHHTPSDGAVAVIAERGSSEVRVSVEDTGAGIAPGTEGRMFDRFWRGDPSRTHPGAGLGLAIARGLVEAQGGRIWAENRAEGGARFTFTLPAAASA